jgi:competence protein ComEA
MFLTASYFAGTDSIYNPILEGKINPNEAAAASLMRLPNIGPKRAEAIIEYRESVNSESPSFQQSADLEKIKGIGPKTVEKIGPWLCFE